MEQSDKNIELEFQKDKNKLDNNLKEKLAKKVQEFIKNMKELDN